MSSRRMLCDSMTRSSTKSRPSLAFDPTIRKNKTEVGYPHAYKWYLADIALTVDRVLDTCFQLISLFFMTIGKTNEAPAAYALTSTIKRLLDHLTEVDLYSVKDLDHIAHTLNRLRSMVKKADSPYPEKLVTLLSSRLDVCQGLLENLENRLGRLGDGMPEIHEKLISILRSMALANTRAKVFVLCHVIQRSAVVLYRCLRLC